MPNCCQSILQPCHYNSSDNSDCSCSPKEYRYPCCVPPFSIQSYQRCSIVCPPKRRNNSKKSPCYSEKFRLFYERGDLPCTIQHTTRGQMLKWFVNDLDMLNIDYYLPIFIDGLCETKYPYSLIAFQGSLNLIEQASHKMDAETLLKVVGPLKRALYTYDPCVIRHVLIILQKLARGNDGAIGVALVPYFSQLLPILNILKQRYESEVNRNEQDCYMIDNYGNNHGGSDLLRLLNDTLVVLEQSGGQDAFLNIKYLVPTYEQQADIKQLSTAQTNTMVKPLLDL